MKLLKWCILAMVLVVGVNIGKPYLEGYSDEFETILKEQFNESEEVSNDDEVEPVNTLVEEGRIKTLFNYLPYLGIEVSEVEAVADPIMPCLEALSFKFNENVFTLYYVDESVNEIKEEIKETNLIDIDGHMYVGVAAMDFIVLVDKVNDLPSLVQSVKEVNGLLSDLGFEKLSIKFE